MKLKKVEYSEIFLSKINNIIHSKKCLHTHENIKKIKASTLPSSLIT